MTTEMASVSIFCCSICTEKFYDSDRLEIHLKSTHFVRDEFLVDESYNKTIISNSDSKSPTMKNDGDSSDLRTIFLQQLKIFTKNATELLKMRRICNSLPKRRLKISTLIDLAEPPPFETPGGPSVCSIKKEPKLEPLDAKIPNAQKVKNIFVKEN